jgi:hypothetical protein
MRPQRDKSLHYENVSLLKGKIHYSYEAAARAVLLSLEVAFVLLVSLDVLSVVFASLFVLSVVLAALLESPLAAGSVPLLLWSVL